MVTKNSIAVSAAVSGLVSLLVGGLINYVSTNEANKVAEARSTRLEQAIQFVGSEPQIYLLAGRYMQAVAGGGDVEAIRQELRQELGKEARQAERLEKIYPARDRHQFEAYRASLDKFAATLQTANSPVEMRPWAEAFGAVNDSRRALTDAIVKAPDASS